VSFSQLVEKVAPGCVADKLRIIGDAETSGEPEHAALLVPVEWQCLGCGSALTRDPRLLMSTTLN
jgi:hypothetical protein